MVRPLEVASVRTKVVARVWVWTKVVARVRPLEMARVKARAMQC